MHPFSSGIVLMRRRGIIVPVVILAVVLGGYVLYPLGVLTAGSLTEGGLLTFSRYLSVLDLGDPSNREAVVNSVLVSVLSVAGSGLLGLLHAFVFTQFRFPFSGFLSRLAVLPVALPPLVGVIAFLFVFGETGILPRIAGILLGGGDTPFALDGIPAILAVHVYSFHVYFYLFLGTALRGIDGSQLEAAASLGAGSWRTFRRVVFPALRPAFTGASLLTFMASMASFSAPFLFGGEHRFMTVQIYLTKLNGEIDLAAAQSVLLLIVSLVFFVFLQRAEGIRRGVAKGTSRTATLRVGRPVRLMLIGASVAVLLVELLPLGMILLLSAVEDGTWTWQLLPPRYTFENFLSLFRDGGSLEPLRNSLLMAGSAAVVAVVVGSLGAYVAVRGGLRRLGTALDMLLMAPYAIPGTVVAIALIMAFQEPSLFTFGSPLVGTFWILPVAYAVRTYPFVVRSAGAALQEIDESILEAGESLGAGPWRRIRRIIVPLVRPGLVGGGILVAISAVGEFVSSVLLYTYDSRPVSVEILSQLRIFRFGQAAALCVVVLGVILLVVGAAGRYAERSRRPAGQQ